MISDAPHPNKLVRIMHDVHLCFREYFDSHANWDHYLDNPEFDLIFETLYFLAVHPNRIHTLCTNIVEYYTPPEEEGDDAYWVVFNRDTIEFPELQPFIDRDPETLTIQDVFVVLKLIVTRFDCGYDRDALYDLVEYPDNHTFSRGILPRVAPMWRIPDFRLQGIKRSTFCMLINLLYKDVHRNITEWVFDHLYKGDRTNNFKPPQVNIPVVSDTIEDAEANNREGFLVVDQWQQPFWVWIKWIDTQLTHDELIRLFHASAGIIHHNGVVVKDYNEHAPYEIWPIINKIRLTSLERVYSRKTREEFFNIPPLAITVPSLYIYDELEGIAKHFTPEFSDAVEALFEACPIANEEQANRYDLTINLMEDIKYVTTSVSANSVE